MIVRRMFVSCRKIKHSTRKYMRLSDSNTKNEVPSGCAYSEAKPFLGGRICSKTRGVYVVNWGVRIVGPIFEDLAQV